jgi:hypothetical protein
MRISIWQQFSSNHSSHFTIVGRFPSEQEAQEAAEKFRHILTTIAKFYEEDPEWSEIYHEQNLISPPEVEFSEQYQVEWGDEPIDWFRNSEHAPKLVAIVKKDVFVSVDFETYSPPTPVENLMAKFGGVVYREIAETIHVVAHISCLAPDLITANAIAEKLNRLGTTKVNQHDCELQIQYIGWRIGKNFPSFIADLESKGCTEIQYTFSQILESELGDVS